MQSIMKHYGPKFELFKKMVQKDNPVIVEIGAHFGEDTLRFLEVFPQGQIHCFEPDPRCIKVFRRYVTDPRATLYELALSNCEGSATFYQSYQEHSDVTWIDVQGAEKDVLDGMGSEIRRIKLVWIEYGEMTYEDSMSRLETVKYFESKGFSLVSKLSTSGEAGDLLFLRTDNA